MFGLFRRDYSHLGEEKIVRELTSKLAGQHPFIVEIGAGNGITMSNTYHLFRQGTPGLAIEYDGEKFERLSHNYKGLQADLCQARVHPDNIVNLLSEYQVPQEFLLLNIDIDSYDYFVLDALLESYHPAIIITEINEVIPPPVKFKVLPDKNFEWRGGHFFGYSLACLEDLCAKFDYSLVRLHYNNAFLVRRSSWNMEPVSTAAAYRDGYWNKPDRRRKFHYNRHLEHLMDLEPEAMVAELKSLFESASEKYEITPG